MENTKKCLLIVTTVSILFHPLAAMDDTDWPHWSGPNYDLTSTGDGAFQGNVDLDLQWTSPVGSSYSGIVVSGERVVTAFSDGESDFLAAFDVASGAELWRHRIAETYEGHDQSDDGPLATPTVHDGNVYALGPWGHLLALRLEDGARLWSHHVVEELGAKAPFAGFATAPTVVGGVLVVQTGGADGHSISGLDPQTGKLLWSAEDDFVMYQSPVVVRVGDEELIFAVTNERALGLRPKTGELLWELPHELSKDRYHGISQPVLTDASSVLINGMTETALFKVTQAQGGYQIAEVWRTQALAHGYSPSVPYQGYIYGFGGSFLTCVSTETGEMVWRSRPPGRGNLILADGHLIVLTRKGEVVVAEASPEGFREKARTQALEYGFYSRPSFAAGRIFIRNLHEIAAVGVVSAETPAADERPELLGKIGTLVQALRASDDKARLIDEFMAANSEVPILEGDTVHFVYRGKVQDLGLGGDMFPAEMPMHNVEGTDFYFRSVVLEPAGYFEYYYSTFGEITPDQFNPRKVDLGGIEVSVLTTRGWKEPDHLRKPEGPRGRIETLTWDSEILGYPREVQVYLPADYDRSAARFGLLVVHGGDEALTQGLMDRTLDNLIGKTVAPVVVAFVPQTRWSESLSGVAQYSQALDDELIPLLDKTYRTIPRPEARGVMGAGPAAAISIYATFERPGLFGKLALQSLYMKDLKDDVSELIASGDQQDLDLYIEWSRHDLQDAPLIDVRAETEEVLNALGKEGYGPITHEAAGGSGWRAWRQRTDRTLETLFPLE